MTKKELFLSKDTSRSMTIKVMIYAIFTIGHPLTHQITWLLRQLFLSLHPLPPFFLSCGAGVFGAYAVLPWPASASLWKSARGEPSLLVMPAFLWFRAEWIWGLQERLICQATHTHTNSRENRAVHSQRQILQGRNTKHARACMWAQIIRHLFYTGSAN